MTGYALFSSCCSVGHSIIIGDVVFIIIIIVTDKEDLANIQKKMKPVLIFVVLIVAATASIMPPWYSQSSDVSEPVKYVLTFPTLIRPSGGYKFNLILFENENYSLPVTFTAKLTSGYDREAQILATQEFTQTTYGLQQHTFDNIQKATGIFDDSGIQVSIDFTSVGLVNYTDLSAYTGQLTEKYVFIQTDKAMYKPSQTIYFRAVALTRQLNPITGPVSVVIEDSKSNQIKQWIDQQLDRGVFGASISLSDYVNFGDWKITFSGANIPTTEKTFTVQQYVLPKYEVKLDFSPVSYWLYGQDDSGYQGFVRAKYTFGKSVRGKAILRLTSTGGCNYRYDYPGGYYYETTTRPPIPHLEVKLQLAGDGSADDGRFLLTGLNKIINSQDSRVSDTETSPPGMMSSMCSMYMQVNVTEELTGEVIKAEGSVVLYRDPYNIKVHDSVQKTLKLGLPYTMRMQVTKPDDTPVGAGQEVSFDVYFWTSKDSSRYSVNCYSPYSYRPSSTEPIRQPNITVTRTTDDYGLISVDVVPPKEIESVLFKATLKKYPTIQNCDTRSPPQSQSKQSVAISIDRPMSMSAAIPKVGDKLTFKIQTSFKTSYIYFLMSQNGESFDYRRIEPSSTTDDSTTYSVEVTLPQVAAPRCAAAVWTVENTANEVLADAIEFKVDGLIRQNVSASFSPQTVRPGEQTSLSIRTTEPNALVALLAVDKSVKLLKSGNDITLDDVIGAVGAGGGSTSVSPVLFRCWRCGWWPWWIDSSNAEQVFSGISMAIKSNARTRTRGHFYPYVDAMMDDAMPMAGAGFRGMAAVPEMAAAPSNAKAPSGSKAPAQTTVRKEFPEMWIWQQGQTDSTGAFSQSLTAPDTITTWVLSAFAVGSQNGFGALDSPAELTVFQPFFVSLDVPYATVVRNEQFEIKAVVFNYQSAPQTVDLVLKESQLFEVSLDGGITYASTQFTRSVSVPANDGTSFSIWIKPKQLGEITLELSGVSASDSSSRDAMQKVVTVEPEGDVRYTNRPVFIRYDSETTQKYTINTNDMFGNVPQEMVVAGSKMFQLQTIGDLLGPALTSLGNQIRLPTGCGEQIMVTLAPNVYIYKYLKSVNSLTAELESKTVRFVEQGYQRELTYQRPDGGYSAFGPSDSASSTWLTAFVMRCFNAAIQYTNVQIDKGIFDKSWNYLKGSAKSDGSFTEPGRILHHSMKGGATSDDNLAAYIYIAYAESGGKYAWPTLAATRSRIEKVAADPATKDAYQLALIAYATSILEDDKVLSKQVLNRLMSTATRDSDLMYWKPANDQSGVSEYSRSGPSQIETSAYVLLTLCRHNLLENATMVARWLMSQRNSLGGFSSTQDTVVGLQALAEFASKLSVSSVKLDISATFSFGDGDKPVSTRFTVDPTNAKLLQSFDLPRDRQSLQSVDLAVTGVGVGLVQLALRYNIKAQKVMDSGDYTILIVQDVMARRKREATSSSNEVTLKSCVQPVTSQAGVGMVIYELGVPTGFTADLEATKSSNKLVAPSDDSDSAEQITSSSALKRIELGDRKIVYYFDALEQQACVVSKMTRTSLVKNAQPPVARVYNYYDPVRVNSTLYAFAGMSSDGTASYLPVRTDTGNVNSAGGFDMLSELSAAVVGLVTLAVVLVVF